MITEHNLQFESAEHPKYGQLYRCGTCEGQWGNNRDSYYILSIINNSPGNGHLNDLFQWFEFSCKRDNKNLLVLHCFNKKFHNHLITKRNFIAMDEVQENVIKIFNKKAYRKFLKLVDQKDKILASMSPEQRKKIIQHSEDLLRK